MTEPQEFSSDFDRWVCSLLDMLRTRYYNVSVNRGSKQYTFFYDEEMTTRLGRYGKNLFKASRVILIPYTQLQTDFKNNQTPQQILDLIK